MNRGERAKWLTPNASEKKQGGRARGLLVLTSLKRMMFGWRSERWLMISLWTFSSICTVNEVGSNRRPKCGAMFNSACERKGDERSPGAESSED